MVRRPPRVPTGPYSLFRPRAIRQANTVITILGLTSTRSSGSAYTRVPIFLAMEMAYLETGRTTSFHHHRRDFWPERGENRVRLAWFTLHIGTRHPTKWLK